MAVRRERQWHAVAAAPAPPSVQPPTLGRARRPYHRTASSATYPPPSPPVGGTGARPHRRDPSSPATHHRRPATAASPTTAAPRGTKQLIIGPLHIRRATGDQRTVSQQTAERGRPDRRRHVEVAAQLLVDTGARIHPFRTSLTWSPDASCIPVTRSRSSRPRTSSSSR